MELQPPKNVMELFNNNNTLNKCMKSHIYDHLPPDGLYEMMVASFLGYTGCTGKSLLHLKHYVVTNIIFNRFGEGKWFANE